METCMVRIGDISFGPNARTNVRGDLERWAEFVANIKERGLQSPVGVQFVDDVPHLVYGFRRVTACHQIWGEDEEIPAVVIDPARDPKVENLLENVARDNLTTADLAKALASLVQAKKSSGGYSAKKLASLTGLSHTHIANLSRLWRNLNDKMREEFSRQHGCGTELPEYDSYNKSREVHLPLAKWIELAKVKQPDQELAYAELLEQRKQQPPKKRGRKSKEEGEQEQEQEQEQERQQEQEEITSESAVPDADVDSEQQHYPNRQKWLPFGAAARLDSMRANLLAYEPDGNTDGAILLIDHLVYGDEWPYEVNEEVISAE